MDSAEQTESINSVVGFVGAEFSTARVRRALIATQWNVDDAIAMLLGTCSVRCCVV